MKSSLVLELLRRYVHFIAARESVIGDPLAGTGVTGVAAALAGARYFVGCEVIPRWHALARKALTRVGGAPNIRFEFDMVLGDAALANLPARHLSAIITSPPFPNAHSQGTSAMQRALRDSKDTFAGNDFECNRDWGVGSTPDPQAWIARLRQSLAPWVEACVSGAPILLHVKNFVRDNREVRVDAWAAEALCALQRIKLLGYHPVPLPYRSGFQEWRRYPRQEVRDRKRSRRNGGWSETLACGHTKLRARLNRDALPKRATCIDCGPRPGLLEIREERVVVAVKL